jgi:hypothetical protein
MSTFHRPDFGSRDIAMSVGIQSTSQLAGLGLSRGQLFVTKRQFTLAASIRHWMFPEGLLKWNASPVAFRAAGLAPAPYRSDSSTVKRTTTVAATRRRSRTAGTLTTQPSACRIAPHVEGRRLQLLSMAKVARKCGSQELFSEVRLQAEIRGTKATSHSCQPRSDDDRGQTSKPLLQRARTSLVVGELAVGDAHSGSTTSVRRKDRCH